MYKANTILTLADLSGNSKPVLEAAITCASHFDSRLIVYHASPNLQGDEQIDELKSSFKDNITEIQKEMKNDHDKINIMVASEDFPSGLLLKQLITDADMVVIGGGRARHSDLKREKIVKIVDMCSQPVLVIPSDRHLSELKNILFCSSYDDLSSESPLEVVKYVAEHFKSEVRVAHVKTHNGSPNEDHVERSKFEGEYFEPEVSYSYKLIRNDDVIDGISAYIRKKGDNDLLVMIRRKHHLFDRVFGKNFTFRMLQHSEIPLLILKESQLN